MEGQRIDAKIRLNWGKTPKSIQTQFSKGPSRTKNTTESDPKNLFGLVIYLLPCKAKKTLRGKSNLGNVNFLLVLKGIFGGSLKITKQNQNNPQGKNKDSLRNFGTGREFGTDVAKRHGEGSEMLVFFFFFYPANLLRLLFTLRAIFC